MVKEFLKMAGVKTEAQFYKKYPSEEAFFRAHPQARQLVHQKMAYGGVYAYQTGGEPISSDYPKYAEFKQAHDVWEASQGIPQVDQSAYELPAAGVSGLPDYLRSQPIGPSPSAATAVASPMNSPVVAAQQSFALNPYQGVSVYDMLEAQGKAGDYKSRKALAQTLGIPNYIGLPQQNAQMMEMIRQNPDVLLNYTGASAPMISAPSKNVSSKTKSKTTAKPTTTKNEAAADNSGSLLGGFKSEYDFGNGSSNATVGASKTAISKSTPGYGKKGDAYADGLIDRSVKNKAMVDYSTQQYFNEEIQKALGKAGISAIGLGGLRNAYEYFQPRYEAYNPNQLPPAGPIPGQRALPAPGQLFPKSQMKQLPPATPRGFTMGKDQVRSANYPMNAQGGYYANVPQHGQPQGPNDGTYYQGGYFEAGGSYNPTSVDYGDALPQFAMGYDVPTAMYGMGMAYGGPTYSDVTQYNHQGDVPAFDWMGNGGTPCYNCGGMYQDGGSPLYSTQGQTLRNFTNTLANSSGWSPSHTMLPAVGPNNRGNGSRTPAGLPNLGRGLTIPMNFENGGMYDARAILNTGPYEGRALVNRFADGGLVKGGEYDMSEDEIQNLIAQGYKIQYI